MAVHVVAVGMLTATLVGCGGDSRGKADAPVQGRRGEDSGAEVYNFPDGFGNLATKCVGPGLRGYTNRHYFESDGDDVVEHLNPNSVVVPDTTCT